MLNYLRKIISPDNPIRLFWHKLKGIVAAVKCGSPAKKMVCIGVTGTNGKTTTVHMIEHILRSSGKKVAMISTVEFRINGKAEPNRSKKTTMSPFLTQKFLKKCLKEGVEYMVIEASSHALHQHRLYGIPFSIAVMTNITHEHLDYHKTMEKYKDAKKILFENVSHNTPSDIIKNIPHKQAMILNTADKYFEEFNQMDCSNKITYGFDRGDIKVHGAAYSKFGSKFVLNYSFDDVEMELKIPGSFNIENAMAAMGASLSCNIELNDAKKALESFKGVAGRMERIKSPKGFEVIVDFALTPDALEKLYKTLNDSKTNRIIGIIGSCGDRDKEKRPLLGEIVAKYCDITIVTDEEPYTENPMDIMQAVLKGAKKIKKLDEDLHLIEDRYKAIEFAVQNATKGDQIVVTGMGNFDTRGMNDGPMKWDEREIAREIIKKYS